MSDRVGTVRRSPNGVTAVRADGAERWLASHYKEDAPGVGAKFSYWRSPEDVASWPVVYIAPPPIGTVMRRDLREVIGDFEVATLTDRWWIIVDCNGDAAPWSVEPYDVEDGSWTVLHGG